MNNRRNITDFFDKDFVNYGSYDNLRKIGNIADGLKNAARKVMYTVLEKNIKDNVKVNQLAGKVAEFSDYLHGDCSGVIVTLGQDYMGTNIIPLIQKSGNFGTRFIHEASAPRYIFAKGSKDFFNLFKREDVPILLQQVFEGSKIEPRFYVPTLPILVINGSEGVSTGFSQLILSRNPDNIKTYLKNILTDHTMYSNTVDKLLTPYFKGFKGTVEHQTDSEGKIIPNSWVIKGKAQRISENTVQVLEIPVGYDLKSYTKVLDKLEDSKVIDDYTDLSDKDQFNFEIKMSKKILDDITEEELLNKLKLSKSVTENYTCIDENNSVVQYDTIEEILNHYIKIKLSYVLKRKTYQLNEISTNINIANAKYKFIKLIIDEKLRIAKRKKVDIEKDLEKLEFLKVNDSFDYLINMPISSMTEEKLEQLKNQIETLKNKYSELDKMSEYAIWLKDISEL